MDVYTRFKHLALQSNESPSSPEGLIQVSVKLKADYVKVIDCFAEQLKISRTELINQLIKGSLPDALRAYYLGSGAECLDLRHGLGGAGRSRSAGQGPKAAQDA